MGMNSCGENQLKERRLIDFLFGGKGGGKSFWSCLRPFFCCFYLSFFLEGGGEGRGRISILP